MRNKYVIVILLTSWLAFASNIYAQETQTKLQTRTNLDLSFKPIKNVKLSLNPELRFDNNFLLDKYLIEGEAEYKITRLFSVAARYGFVGNLRDEKSTEYFKRYAFSTQFEKEYNRFEPSLGLIYSNYADDDVDDKNFLRYKARVKYDIRDSKFTPFAGVQFFRDLNEGGFYKTRYTIGADYKLFKKNYLGVSYKLDSYNAVTLSKHIISVGYKIKF